MSLTMQHYITALRGLLRSRALLRPGDFATTQEYYSYRNDLLNLLHRGETLLEVMASMPLEHDAFHDVVTGLRQQGWRFNYQERGNGVSLHYLPNQRYEYELRPAVVTLIETYIHHWIERAREHVRAN